MRHGSPTRRHLRRLALGAAMGALLQIHAQPPGNAGNQNPADVRQKLAEVQARLAQVDQQMNALKKRRKGVLVEMQKVSLQADRARAQAEGARLKRDQTQAEVHQITTRKGEIQKEILQLRKELKRQVRWMQAVGPWGGLSFFPTLSSLEKYLVQGRYLAYWRGQERSKLDRIQHLQGDLAQREKDLQASLQRLSQEEMEATQIQGSLRLSEDQLSTFLDGLRQDESRQKEVQAELAEEAIQLERMLNNLLGRAKPDAFDAAVSFASLKGELPRPVEGSLGQAFGEHLHPKFHTRTVQSGLLIEAGEGSRVQAVADGRVVFAESYQSYGPMVIVDHGGGYFSLYTHLRTLNVAKGQTLRACETLGSVGETVEGPRLGFEIRHLAQPQDPNKWLKDRYR
ncbi:MAG TPA: peptidoglycan DD-metalloendopeptidase family protein [Holophaga sp.]|nr:peptidoglycan DD-metalloendopeptidase family protein [Holophaga sp.]